MDKKLSLKIIPVNQEADWDKYLPILNIFEKNSDTTTTPLTTSQVQYTWWHSDIKSRFSAYLFIIAAAENPSGILAYNFFSMSQDKNRFLNPCTLKAFDDIFFMSNHFFNRHCNLSAEAVQVFLSTQHILKQIYKKTGASLITWQPVPPVENREHIPRHFSPWKAKKKTDYPYITMAQDTSYFDRAEVVHAVKDIRKQTKRVINKFKTPPLFSSYHHNIDTIPENSFEENLARLFALRKKTWQYQWEKKSMLVNTEILTAKIASYSSVWRMQGSLYLYFLTIDGQDVAYLYTLQTEKSCWCLLIGYDLSYKTYSPGKQIFHKMLQETHAKGIVNYHMGGSVVGWKSDWLTHNIPLHTVELWLLSPKALIHRVMKTISHDSQTCSDQSQAPVSKTP